MSQNPYQEVIQLLAKYFLRVSPEQIKEYLDEYNENSYEEQWKNLLKETYDNVIYLTNARDGKKSIRACNCADFHSDNYWTRIKLIFRVPQ